MSRVVHGVNPVIELLKSGETPVDEILLARGRGDRRAAEITRLAKAAGVRVRNRPRVELTRLAESENHQGVVARVAEFHYLDPEEIIDRPGPGVVVILDGIQDPHNLGAIARTALAAGAKGLIIPKDRAAGVTGTALKASAGALEHLPVGRATNLNRLAGLLKERGWWLVGTAGQAPTGLYELADPPDRLAVIIGAEGRGIGRALAEKCDFLVSIPLTGPVDSLNASAAAAVVLFELRRRSLAGE